MFMKQEAQGVVIAEGSLRRGPRLVQSAVGSTGLGQEDRPSAN